MEVDPNQSYSCPNGQTVTVKDLVNIYGDAVKQPIPTSGVLSTIPGSSKLNLKVSYSSRDVSVLERSSFAKIYTLDVGDGSNIQVESPTFPLDNSSMSAEVVSPSGKLRAALRSANDDQYLDIWNSRSKIQVINLSSLDAHGEIETGFGNLSFSPDESSLLYVAEAKRPRTESFFKNNLNGDSTPKLYGSEYLYKQDWGEGSPGVIHTVACVLRLADLKITVIDVPNYSASECFWITSAKVGFLGWKEFPKRIGLVYTANRPTKVFAAEVESNNVTELSSRDNLSVRCPRVSPSGSFLIWLENAAHGPHNCASQLILFDIATNQRQVVIDFEVKKEQVNANDVTLKALFIDPLPDQCWSKDETTVFFQSDTCNRQGSLVSEFGKKSSDSSNVSACLC
ncbi:Acylamino-acid-releasing enzyme [Halotydeus destructor]|nr:Acylamino-acid-releasing enzyme [Halotydeus destructor]